MDLKELFQNFRMIRRTFLAKDKVTQQSKVGMATSSGHAIDSTPFHGFAFVSFVNREDAANAIRNLDGSGYDHLILKVEWAK